MSKFKKAGEIAQTVLKEVIAKCIVGADIHEICKFGNQRIVELTEDCYNNKKMEKGVSFPVCISQNHISAHYSPLQNESSEIKEGLLKIDLGVHIDGFPCVLAHTIFVGENRDQKQLAATRAAYHALLTAVKQMTPGTSNYSITDSTVKICEKYNVSPVQGILSHELSKYIIDGKKVIKNHDNPDHKVEEFKLEKNLVFGLDVMVSANEKEGKVKISDSRTTVYKKNVDVNHDLKTKMGRQFINDVNKRFHDMAFSLIDFDNALNARVGLSESLKMNHLQPYEVLEEKSGAPVAQFKWTVAVSGKRVLIFAAHQELDFELDQVKGLEDSLQKLVDTDLTVFTSKKKKSKK